MTRSASPPALLGGLMVLLIAFALLRGIDHDESQYVAAAVLVAEGKLPYRDFAYLQTPLQPLLFAPVASIAGTWAWPALRIVNALLGGVVIAACWRAMREAGVSERITVAAAALMASCDILLFSGGTARNEVLPAALLSTALIPMLRAERGTGTRSSALLVGLLLAGAAAAKLSYAVPAVAYGVYAITVRRHRGGWVTLGALPVALLVALNAAAAPAAFVFDVLTFPRLAPAEHYTASGQAWRVGGAAKLFDTLKFLALGPAALALVAVGIPGVQRPKLLDWLILAGLVAALLPSPTWRQYLLPMLPPLFIRLALAWQARPPRRPERIAAAVFACGGLTPTAAAIVTPDGIGTALREGRAVAVALDRAGFTGRITTLAPQFVPASGRPIDPRFAPGPFYFRSRGLLSPSEETAFGLVGRGTLTAGFETAPPAAILIGGEGRWTGGDDRLDAALEGWAIRAGWHHVPTATARLRLYLPPRATAGTISPSSSAAR